VAKFLVDNNILDNEDDARKFMKDLVDRINEKCGELFGNSDKG